MLFSIKLLLTYAGLPGAIGAVFVSRLSTELHAFRSRSPLSHVQAAAEIKMIKTGVILLGVSLPVVLLYVLAVWAIGWLDLPLAFLGIFLPAFCLSVGILSFVICFLAEPLDPG
jgi:solute carrier family 41